MDEKDRITPSIKDLQKRYSKRIEKIENGLVTFDDKTTDNLKKVLKANDEFSK